jgi:hypothetical protein
MEPEALEIRRSMIWNKQTLPSDDVSSHKVVHYLAVARCSHPSQAHLVSIGRP